MYKYCEGRGGLADAQGPTFPSEYLSTSVRLSGLDAVVYFRSLRNFSVVRHQKRKIRRTGCGRLINLTQAYLFTGTSFNDASKCTKLEHDPNSDSQLTNTI